MKKRHEALIPLSHHHHHALVIALKLKKASESGDQASINEARQETIDFWENGGEEHFREEEEVLLPAYAKVASVDTPNIKTMLIDHVVIRSWMGQLKEGEEEDILPLMQAIGERLQGHVRLEERHIFPEIEEALTDATIKAIKPSFHLNFHPKSEN